MSTSNSSSAAVNREDHTGRGRLLWNVLASWGGHSIFVMAGFVMPRLIDRQLGQEALGIWDFAWSLTSYFNLAQAGIGSSINRYVAAYRASGDTQAMNGAVSSIMCAQVVVAMIVMLLTILAAQNLSFFFHDQQGPLLDAAWWVVLLLGFGLAVEILCDSFGGVMTGCHRWDLYHGINAGFYAFTTIIMTIALLQGGGLPGLALASLTGTILSEGTRTIMAYRVCPELRVRWQYVNWPQMSELFAFGGKVVLGAVSGLLIYQTTSLFIVKYLGVGALAIYARAMAPVRHCHIFVDKFASILTTTASSLQAGGRREDVQRFLLETSRHSMAMALPPVLLLTVLGGSLLHLWMGAAYVYADVLAVLALGHLMSMAQAPAWTILRGLNKHGLLVAIRLCGAAAIVMINWVALHHFQVGLLSTALAVTIPLSLLDGIFLAWYATRQLNISFGHYIWFAWLTPVLWVVPFTACLLCARFLFPHQPVGALVTGMTSGGIVVGIVYWYYLFPHSLREKLLQKMPGIPERAVLILKGAKS